MPASMENSQQCADSKKKKKTAVLTPLPNAGVVAINVTTWDQLVFNEKGCFNYKNGTRAHVLTV